MYNTHQDYKEIFTDIIRYQFLVLGPLVTLTKARTVKGLTIADNGTVTTITGNPQEIFQQYIEKFNELSDCVVRETIGIFFLANQHAQANIITSPQTKENQTVSLTSNDNKNTIAA